jgi:hypothetical protein
VSGRIIWPRRFVRSNFASEAVVHRLAQEPVDNLGATGGKFAQKFFSFTLSFETAIANDD